MRALGRSEEITSLVASPHAEYLEHKNIERAYFAMDVGVFPG